MVLREWSCANFYSIYNIYILALQLPTSQSETMNLHSQRLYLIHSQSVHKRFDAWPKL